MINYYARICWNERGWTQPTSSAKDGPKTFFGRYGFGLEEWLFDTSATIDGWQYGFLQPINKGYKKRAGKAFSLRLYSIPGGGVAKYREEYEIPYCEVLKPRQAERVHAIFRRRGRIGRMIEQVRAIGGDPTPLITDTKYFENIINVRFRLDNVSELSHRKPLLRGDYYALYEVPGSDEIEIEGGHPDEIESECPVWDGALKRVTVNIYERDPRARKECLKHWGHKCKVCQMSFLMRYGPLGTDFIHVHHLVPLASIKKSYKVDGKRDLIPVCPNCHAMLHKGKTPPSVEELRQYLRDADEGMLRGE